MRPVNKEDLELPGNPCLQATVREFLDQQKKMLSENPEFKAEAYECRRCGDCCLWNYYALTIQAKLLKQLYLLAPYPHGYWVLIEGKIHCYMPVWSKPSESNLLHFDGYLPKKHTDFLARTGRRHGYWVLDTEKDKILVYNPVPCNHLVNDIENRASCDIYMDRPEVCRDYTCGRYPIK